MFDALDLRDPTHFERAYRENRGRALSAAVRVLHDEAAAEDVVQEVFTHLWRNPGRFDPRRGSLSTYVGLLARSRALDHWRARSVRKSADDRLARSEEADPRSADSVGEAVLRADARSVLDALGAAPDDQREAVLLAYGGGLTAKQIASLRSVPVGTAKSRIRLGLEKARAALEAA